MGQPTLANLIVSFGRTDRSTQYQVFARESVVANMSRDFLSIDLADMKVTVDREIFTPCHTYVADPCPDPPKDPTKTAICHLSYHKGLFFITEYGKYECIHYRHAI